MGGACGMYGIQNRCVQGFGGETTDTDYWEEIGVDGRIILKLIYKKWNGEA
jgi:hypothetical protein